MSSVPLFVRRVSLQSRLVWSLLVLTLLGLGGPAWGEGPGEEPGPRVRAVEIRTSMPLHGTREVRRLVSIPVGQPLLSDDVRRTLRNLQASGRVSEVEIWTRPVADGVVVSVAIWGSTLVDSVELEGELQLKKRDLERVVEQRAGQPLVEDRIVRSVFALQSLYEREGFDRAKVRVAVEQDPTGHEAQVVFNIEPGVRRRIATLNFEGVETLDEAEVRKAFGLEVGNSYRERTVREASESLGVWLRKRGYLASDVTVLPVQKESDGKATLDVQVGLGPRYSFDIRGWDSKKIQKADLLPSTGWDPSDDFFLHQTQSRIRNFLQKKGHYRAVVEVHSETEPEEDTLRVVVEIVPGPIYRLVETVFEGNDHFTDERLEDLMATSAKNTLVLGSGRLVDDVLNSDLSRVRSFYALSGWPEATVGPAEIHDGLDEAETPPETPPGSPPGEDKDALPLRLEIPVVEGRQTRVVDIEWVGVEAIELQKVREGLPLTPGGPYHPQRLDETLDLIRSRYEARGYAKVLVNAETDWNEEQTLVDVTLRIQEGEQQRLGRVIIRGNQRLDTRVLLGLAGFEVDEPLSQARLFKAQLALYRLGVFSRVSVTLAPGGDESALRDVVIRVVEGDAQRTSYGIGYDSEEGVGGLFGYSHRNLWGKGLRFQVDLRASQKSQNYRLLFSRPFWKSGRRPGSQKILLTSLDEDRASFSVEQRGAELELSWDRDRTDYSLFFDLRSSDLTLDDDVVIGDADLPDGQDGRDLQDIDIFSITPRWRWDRRDDPIDPKRGFLTSMQMEYAVPIEGLTTENFRKFFAQASGYWPMGRAGVLALNLRAGVIEPLGSQPVSIAERFFAGGSTTHRAYDRDTLGVVGDTLDSRGNPVGGNGLFLANLDWRFPIGGGLGGTLFYDLGNVWGDWHDFRIEDAKGGVGVGVRYLSPVGPLRLDLGWKLDREPEESEYEVFFSFGNAF